MFFRSKYLLLFTFFVFLTIVLFIFSKVITYTNSYEKDVPLSSGGDVAEEFDVNNTDETIIETKILFTGDVFLGRDVERKLLRSNDMLFPWRGLQDTFNYHDFVVVNFEGAVPEQHRETPDFDFNFSIRKDIAQSMSSVGVTHASLANNHAFDFGAGEYINTRAVLLDSGVVPFGHPLRVDAEYSTTVLETEVGAVLLMGIHTLFAVPSNDQLLEVYQSFVDDTVFQIVYIHWGEEYNPKHSLSQIQFAQDLFEIGFDMIIGHHPHVVQDIQVVDDKLIFYSLGNTIFDQYFSVDVQEGLLLSLKLRSNDDHIVELLPISSLHSRIHPNIMSGSDALRFLLDLSEKSHASLREYIVNGTIHLKRLAQ